MECKPNRRQARESYSSFMRANFPAASKPLLVRHSKSSGAVSTSLNRNSSLRSNNVRSCARFVLTQIKSFRRGFRVHRVRIDIFRERRFYPDDLDAFEKYSWGDNSLRRSFRKSSVDSCCKRCHPLASRLSILARRIFPIRAISIRSSSSSKISTSQDRQSRRQG